MKYTIELTYEEFLSLLAISQDTVRFAKDIAPHLANKTTYRFKSDNIFSEKEIETLKVLNHKLQESYDIAHGFKS